MEGGYQRRVLLTGGACYMLEPVLDQISIDFWRDLRIRRLPGPSLAVCYPQSLNLTRQLQTLRGLLHLQALRDLPYLSILFIESYLSRLPRHFL